MFYDHIRHNVLDKKNGLELVEPVLNSSIGTLYNDFVAGTFDMIIGSWDPFLTRYHAGVPCRLLCSLMTADMIGVVAAASGPQPVAELEGKMIVAPQQSGVYRMTKALISEFEGIDIEKVARVQNADNPAQGVTLVIADRADAAVAWEPMISQGIERRSDLGIIFNAGEAFRKHTSQSLPYFCITVRKELLDRSPDMADRLNAMFAECVKRIDADFDALAEKYAGRTMLEAKVLKVAKSAGRLRFDYNAASDSDFQETMTSASEILVRQGILAKPADSGFFAG
jgi:NitT/TauT family transport system substrate-binding protein